MSRWAVYEIRKNNNFVFIRECGEGHYGARDASDLVRKIENNGGMAVEVDLDDPNGKYWEK